MSFLSPNFRSRPLRKVSGWPESLTEEEIGNPFLYKIYVYLRAVFFSGSFGTDIKKNFTRKEINLMVQALRDCKDDPEFMDKLNKGVCERVGLRANNIYGRIDRTFKPSVIRSAMNKLENINPFRGEGEATEGEIQILDCLLYQYADDVFLAKTEEETGWVDRTSSQDKRPMRKYELQLPIFNKLFCNMGNRLVKRRDKLISAIAEDKITRTDEKGNKITESIPQELIMQYVKGGKSQTKKYKKRKNKRRKRTMKRV